MIGALSRYISDESVKNFQPMGANFGVLPPLPDKIRDKQERYMCLANRGMNSLKEFSDAAAEAISFGIEHDVLISDMEKILSSNKKKYINKNFTDEIQELIYKQEIVVKKQADGSEMLEFFAGTGCDFSCQLIVPIVKDGDAIGSIIILAMENKCFDDSSVKTCKAFAKYLSGQIQ
jgi:LytS/YehU family sensor histidine kinase